MVKLPKDNSQSFKTLDALEELRKKINENLPEDIKIFCLIQVGNKFNAKNMTSHREYSYYLPTFMFTPISQVCLERPPGEDKTKKEKSSEPEEETK